MRTATPGLDLGEVRSTLTDDAGNYQYRRIQGNFRHDWNMRRYPFDRHRLVIPFDESDLGAAVVVFEPDLESSFLSPEIRSRLPECRHTSGSSPSAGWLAADPAAIVRSTNSATAMRLLAR